MSEGRTTSELRAHVLAVQPCPHGLFPPAPHEEPIMFAGPISACPCCRLVYGFKYPGVLCHHCRDEATA